MNLTTNVGEDVERKETSFTAGGGGCKVIQPLWKSTFRVFKKIKTRTTIWPLYFTPGIYPENFIHHRRICIPMFITSLFTIISLTTQQQENR